MKHLKFFPIWTAVIAGVICGLVCVVSLRAYAQSLGSDAIAIRIISNPNYYNIGDWYTSQGFSGSPTPLLVDGYDALQDGQTVYVAGTNIVDEIVYPNIYIITANQGAQAPTLEVFNKLLASWKLNTNFKSDNVKESGQCVNAQTSVISTVNCRLDSECLAGAYCNGGRAQLVRDFKRLSSIFTIQRQLTNYFAKNNRYPLLSSGTYIPKVVISTWPSWQEVFAPAIQFSGTSDPINIMGDCKGFETSTCWDTKTKSFYKYDAKLNQVYLPANSKVMVYTASAKGDAYNLCAGIENFDSRFYNSGNANSINLKDYACNSGAAAATFNSDHYLSASYNLSGVTGQEFAGFIKLNSVDNSQISVSILPQGDFSSWPDGPPVLQNTVDPSQKKLYAKVAGAPGSYRLQFNFLNNAIGSTVLTESVDIVISGTPVKIIAEDLTYYLNASSSLNYNAYFETPEPFVARLYKNGSLVNTLSTNSQSIGDGLTAVIIKEGATTSPKFRLAIGGYITSSWAYSGGSNDLKYTLTLGGGSNSADFAIKVKQSPPVLSMSCAKRTALNVAYNCDINNVNNNSHIKSYTLSSGGLTGLTINTSTGAISGVPRTVGDFNLIITAKDDYNAATSINYNLKVENDCGNKMVMFAGGPWNITGDVKNQGGYYRTVQIGQQCWLRDNLGVASLEQSINRGLNFNISAPAANCNNAEIYFPGRAIEFNNALQSLRPGSFLPLKLRLLFDVVVKALSPATAQAIIRPEIINIIGRCYNDFSAFCLAEGRLYNYAEATVSSRESGTKGICPTGYHVPSDNDWKKLELVLGVPSSQIDSVGISPRGTSTSVGVKITPAGLSGFDAPYAGEVGFNGTGFNSYGNPDVDGYYNGSYWTSNISLVNTTTNKILLARVREITNNPQNNQDLGIINTATLASYSSSLRCVEDTPCPTVCASNQRCDSSGECVPKCEPNCSNKMCGGDGCGGSCGACVIGSSCTGAGQCVCDNPATETLNFRTYWLPAAISGISSDHSNP